MCEKEGEGEGQGQGQRVHTDLCESEALFLNLAYLKLEFLRLGFTFSKPSLRDTRSMRPDSTWRVHVELEFLEYDHIRRQKPSLKGSI